MPEHQKVKIHKFTVIVERDEDGVYIARVPSLKGCHTFAQTWEELQERVKEVIELCLEIEEEEQGEVPSDNQLVGAFQLEVSR